MRIPLLLALLASVAVIGCSATQPLATVGDTSVSCDCCCCCEAHYSDASSDDSEQSGNRTETEGRDPAPESSDDPSTTLPSATGLELIPQETETWCWAATGQMLMARLGTDVPQCVQADIPGNRTDCCEDDLYSCYGAGWLAVRSYGFSSTSTASALTDTKVSEELAADRPFSFTWQWRPDEGAIGSGTDAGGHVTVVAGTMTIDGELHLVIYDPLPVNEGTIYTIPYKQYQEGNEDYTHWNTDYNIHLSATASGM